MTSNVLDMLAVKVK